METHLIYWEISKEFLAHWKMQNIFGVPETLGFWGSQKPIGFWASCATCLKIQDFRHQLRWFCLWQKSHVLAIFPRILNIFCLIQKFIWTKHLKKKLSALVLSLNGLFFSFQNHSKYFLFLCFCQYFSGYQTILYSPAFQICFYLWFA